MFTGIVEEIGTINKVQEHASGVVDLGIGGSTIISDLSLGGSISVNGVCLTITGFGENLFETQVVPETLRKTNLGLLHSGDAVNLERPVLASGRLDGHIVQGHIDDTAKIDKVSPDGSDALLVTIKPPHSIMKYIVPKGFIAIDGTSLTVVDCDTDSFTITLIPYTLSQTVLGSKKEDEIVNIEVDILSKYVEFQLSVRNE